MRINEVVNDVDSELQRAINKGYNVRLVDNKFPTWTFEDSLTPVILMTRRHFVKAVDILDEEELKRYLYHPFFGVFPHEYNEAMVALQLLTGDVDKVLEQYPTYQLSQGDRKLISKYGFRDIQDVSRHPKSHEYLFEVYGGLAHDIVISNDPTAYRQYIDIIDDKIGITY